MVFKLDPRWQKMIFSARRIKTCNSIISCAEVSLRTVNKLPSSKMDGVQVGSSGIIGRERDSKDKPPDNRAIVCNVDCRVRVVSAVQIVCSDAAGSSHCISSFLLQLHT